MAHTYCSLLFHRVFSTRERRKLISEDLSGAPVGLYRRDRARARNEGSRGGRNGGPCPHSAQPATKAISQAMREIKQGSSRWMHETCGVAEFAWQEGYGAFSVGTNQVDATVAYIAGQQEHHRERDFQAEYVAFLKKHKIEYDPRYVWG